MIIQFSVENFRSIMAPATLSMVVSPLKDNKVESDDVMFGVEGLDFSLLKSAVVMGANASGKSNVIKAFDFFKNYLIDSFKSLQAGEEIGVEAFRLNTESSKSPSSFEMIFIIADNQYRYGMDVSREAVHSEWLYRKACRKRAKEVELFYREGEDIKVHTSFTIAADLVNRKMIRKNALLLSAAAQFNDPTAVQIINWLNGTTILSCSDEERMWDMAVSHLDDMVMRQRIVEFSKFADLGIEDIEKSDNHILSRHLQYDAEGAIRGDAVFPFQSMESEGTIKYLSMAYPIIKALDTGTRLIIDEFDSKLHPVLTNRIISLFNSRETNPRNAQLIFTAHDTNLLSSGLFRRDQIWFTQKDRFGATSLYSLSDYKVRSDASFERDYLSGKYGATPIIGNLESVLKKGE
jgi:AAA15 family ATPase/GTPase